MANNTGYAHLFRGGDDIHTGPGQQYLFSRNLGTGTTGAAQLVLHVQSNQPLVRKTRSPRCLADQMGDPINTAERDILEYLHDQDEPVPNINNTRGSDDIYPPGGARPFRIIYLDYCNGGDLAGLYAYLQNSRVRPSRMLRLQLIKQLCEALNFLYTRDVPIFHLDLKMANVFLNWTSSGNMQFFLGDFGFSVMGQMPGDDDAMNSRLDLAGVRAMVKQLGRLPGNMIGPADPGGADVLLNAIYREIQRLSNDLTLPQNQPPDMTNLMAMIDQIQLPDPASEPWAAYNPNNAHLDNVQPLYHGTRDACLQPRLQGIAVHGPWHVAYVDGVGPDGAPLISSYEAEMHHRPTGYSNDDNSNDGF